MHGASDVAGAASGSAVDPRVLSKWLQLMISGATNTMAFSITPYFSADAKHNFEISETAIGLVFASFPAGYMLCSAAMSCANISHVRLSTLSLWIRVFVFLFTGFSCLFAITPTVLYDPQPSSHGTAVGLRYAILFGAFRLMQGISVAVLDVLILLYLTKLFPDAISAVVGQKEAVLGLGVVFGPPLGGFLYKAGGFSTPPLATGGLVMLISLVTYVVLRRSPDLRSLHDLQFIPSDYKWRSTAAAIPAIAPSPGETDQLIPSEGVVRPQDTERGFSEAVQNDPLSDDALVEPEIPKMTLQNLKDLFTQLPLYATVGPVSLTILSIACFAFLESMVPLYASDAYGIEAWTIGLTMGGSAIVYAAVAIALGSILNERRARLRPHAMAIFSIVLAAGMFLVAPSFSVVAPDAGTPRHGFAFSVVGIMVCASAMAAIAVVGVSLMVDQAKAFHNKLVPTAGALVNLGMSVGGVLGPVVGSAVAESQGFPVAFFSFSVAAVVLGTAFWGLFALQENCG